MQKRDGSVLVGDFGGTNVRLACARLMPDGAIAMGAPIHARTAELSSAHGFIANFLSTLPKAERPSRAYLAVAGAVRGGCAVLTNVGLEFSEEALRRAGFAQVRLFNDFEALAHAVPYLPSDHLIAVGGPPANDLALGYAVLGAGTGFGVARGRGGSDEVVVTEGGHVSFAPSDEAEIEILRHMQQRFGRVSVERILSGPGLISLYDVLRTLHNAQNRPAAASSHEIIAAAAGGEPLALGVVEHFVRIFGTVAGDFALALGARGGLFLAGGATRALSAYLSSPLFRARFEDKGRFRAYVAEIRTAVIVADNAAHYGLAHLAATHMRAEGI